MGEWIGALPALATAALVLFFPGLLACLGIGLRGLWLWATAPAISLASWAGGAVILPWIGVSWNPISASLISLGLCGALVLLIRVIVRSPLCVASRSTEHSRRIAALTVAALLLTGGLLATATAIGLQSPDSISQTWDNVHHLGAVRYILDTGNASPFWIATYAAPTATNTFYPDLWHVLAALITQISGAELPVAINALNLVVAATVWPLGAQLLIRQITTPTPTVVLATAILSAAFPAYPLNLLTYGVLYPLFLGLALLPLALALLTQGLAVSRETQLGKPWAIGTVGVVVIATIGLAHPAAFMALLSFSISIVAAAYFPTLRRKRANARVASSIAVLAFLTVGAIVFLRSRPKFRWPAQTDLGTAIWQGFSGNFLGAGIAFLIGAMALTGTIVALTRRDRLGIAFAGVWLTGVILYIVAAGADSPLLRRLVAAWYADTPRLGAVAVVATIPITVYGFTWIIEQFQRASRLGKPLPFLLAGGILLAVLATAEYPRFLQIMRMSYDYSSDRYIDAVPPVDRALLGNLSPDGTRIELNNLLSEDEAELLTRLPQSVPADAVIAGSPWTGTTLAYALSERRTLPSFLTTRTTPTENIILQQFAFEPNDPQVCAALNETGVRYVLDFGERELHSKHNSFYPGIDKLDDNPAVQLVDQEGEAKLFKIVSCGLS